MHNDNIIYMLIFWSVVAPAAVYALITGGVHIHSEGQYFLACILAGIGFITAMAIGRR